MFNCDALRQPDRRPKPTTGATTGHKPAPLASVEPVGSAARTPLFAGTSVSHRIGLRRVNARGPASISGLGRASRHDARTNDARSGNTTSCQRAQATSTLVSVATVHETLQIAVCVLISIAAVVPLFFVWRDDHKWMDRSGV